MKTTQAKYHLTNEDIVEALGIFVATKEDLDKGKYIINVRLSYKLDNIISANVTLTMKEEYE